MIKSRKSMLVISTIAITSIITLAVLANDNTIPSAFSQYSTILSENNPTIKVTGDASIKLEPDQVVMTITMQSPPSDITSALDKQKEKTQKLVDAIQSSLKDDKTSVTIGQVSLNPFYSGQPSYSDINTFTIYASTSVETDIDNFAVIVKKLTEEGYSFENVYASPFLARAASGSPEPMPEGEITPFVDESKQITINVVVNTKPDTLNNVLGEYEKKYANLLQILDDIGIPSDHIKTANVNVNPTYYGPGQNSNYNTYSQIIVKTEPKNIETISKIVNQEGTAYIESTSLSVSESAVNNARDELNQKALENAKIRADSLAKLAGLKVKGVQSIDAVNPFVNQNGGLTSIYGVYMVQPYYYQNLSGEIVTSIIVEFELGR
jgi:uncharacterized protein YggE